MFRFTIRDILFLTVVVALALAWRMQIRQRQAGSEALQKIQEVVSEQERELDSIELCVIRGDGAYLGMAKSWAKQRRKKRETEEALAGKYDPDKTLVGEWEVVDMIFKGTVQDFRGQSGGWMTFQYGKWSRADSDHRYGVQYSYTIVGPGQIDIDLNGLGLLGNTAWIQKCLYEHKDGQLRLVWNNESGEERPTHFDALMDRTLTLYVVRKVP
jgi:hypothetical protein